MAHYEIPVNVLIVFPTHQRTIYLTRNGEAMTYDEGDMFPSETSLWLAAEFAGKSLSELLFDYAKWLQARERF